MTWLVGPMGFVSHDFRSAWFNSSTGERVKKDAPEAVEVFESLCGRYLDPARASSGKDLKKCRACQKASEPDFTEAKTLDATPEPEPELPEGL